MHFALLILFSCLLFSCKSEDKAQAIIEKSIAFHGGDAYNTLTLEFDFRDKHYLVQKNGGAFRYERVQQDSSGARIHDVLTNAEFYRTLNDERQDVPDSTREKYRNAVNSVAYFMLLPQPLHDPAVQSAHVGETTIKGKRYDKIKVSFASEGGGQDHEDMYVYYFDQTDGSMDYFSYLYHVNQPGMRFREAINPRRVGGVLVQDYINFAPADTSMAVTEQNLLSLDTLYQQNGLREFSRIENKDVKAGKE